MSAWWLTYPVGAHGYSARSSAREKALGYQKAITYTLADEPGISPRAAGFHRALPTAEPHVMATNVFGKCVGAGDENPMGSAVVSHTPLISLLDITI